jgi:hypothetical protein
MTDEEVAAAARASVLEEHCNGVDEERDEWPGPLLYEP